MYTACNFDFNHSKGRLLDALVTLFFQTQTSFKNGSPSYEFEMHQCL